MTPGYLLAVCCREMDIVKPQSRSPVRILVQCHRIVLQGPAQVLLAISPLDGLQDMVKPFIRFTTEQK